VIDPSLGRSRQPGLVRGLGFALSGPGRAPLLLVLALYVLLRVPSWFEPHWYTDEAGYATTAWLSTHGQSLYLTVWNNKPPLLFWIYDLALSWFGPTELGIHLLSTVAGVLALAALWQLLRRRGQGPRLWVPLLVAAVLIGTPILNGDLAMPEGFLIAPEAWAMVLLTMTLSNPDRRGQWLLAAGSGVLFGAACLIQQTAIAPAATAAALLLVFRGRRGLGQTVALVGALVAVVGAGLAPYLVSAGLHNLFFFLVQSFESYTAGSLPVGPATLIPRALGLVLLLAGILTTRGYNPTRRVGLAWLGADLVGYVLPNRAYPHFLLPAVVPACLLLGLAVLPGWGWWRGHVRLLPLVAALLVATALWVEVVASQVSAGSLYTVEREGTYLPLFVERATGQISADQYTVDYNTEALGERLAVAWIDQHHLRGATAVVWSVDAWAYILANLKPEVPATPIYVDSDWLGTNKLIRLVKAARPELVVLTPDAASAFGPIQPLLDRDYHRVERSAHGSVWIIDSAVARFDGG
jgi:hypothetical protein